MQRVERTTVIIIKDQNQKHQLLHRVGNEVHLSVQSSETTCRCSNNVYWSTDFDTFNLDEKG